ncbi:BTB/POZ domain-containing protein [Quillaja saponaria]|uniref:BTB/POZ domain-containing protein n=1 Tax=Quillaja saponaria TaxID=32244 RepID=A0AAD7M2J9_QUISA|nr:BTB/POZ domain-containing protein [Quillaja saponaria]KAJ7967861.1 BTB/POZ domain-containing protein [Quillaja saponaria]KAJ7967862.1 BTB/POZ domain-containing protein [Quillaja saponaria]
MKFMKIGTRPDTFYTEEATRSLISDIPTDLVIHIKNINYLLHKFPLLPKCGLLQRLCSDFSDSENVTIELHDIPGGEDAFELCAKFCYGITINLSAHNFVPAFCAAKFLRMTDSVEKGNFIAKLEAFFNSCILEGWKDSIATLQTTAKLPDWSENLGIVRKCIDSIIEKTLTPPAQVKWSYTYTRPGYSKKHHHSVPKDWWTEDLSDLDIDLFRCIIMAIRSTYMLPPQLIGEALHVYACRWLPDTTKLRLAEGSTSQTEEAIQNNKKILENIVSMIPADRGSVSFGFLLRLLCIANYLGVSPMTKTELIRRASLQFDEATVGDLLYPSTSTTDQHFYDIDLVQAVLESFLALCKRMPPSAAETSQFMRSIRNTGKLIDSYLQGVARDDNMPVSKLISLAEAVPDIARPEHDDLYKAINIYLKGHDDLCKADKKRLCRILDCQKLSPEVRTHAVKNERLPLRTVVQVLYYEQEKSSKVTASHKPTPPQELNFGAKLTPTTTRDNQGKQWSGPEEELSKEETTRRTILPETKERDKHKLKRSDDKLPLELERKAVLRGELVGVESDKGKEVREENLPGIKLDAKKITTRASSKGRER